MIWSPLARLLARNSNQVSLKDDAEVTNPSSIRRPAAMGSRNINEILKDVTIDVVEGLGYIGAVVATVEIGEKLPIRAYHFAQNRFSEAQMTLWRNEIGQYFDLLMSNDRPLNLIDQEYLPNLAIQASKMQTIRKTDHLFHLLTPYVPDGKAGMVQDIQRYFGITEIIALPFFQFAEYNNTWRKEQVGILIAIADHKIGDDNIRLLSAFARQAASAIESEQRRYLSTVTQDIVSLLHLNMSDEQAILQNIVRGVVEDLHFAGAIVATYEEIDNSLPVRAMYLDPTIASMEDIHLWEKRASVVAQRELSITNPDIARVYMDDVKYADNLSWKAVKEHHPVTSDSLYDLLTPFIPAWGGQIIEEIQNFLNIRQVVAVPFYINKGTKDNPQPELVGNLFAATRSSRFTVRELELLEVFGEQAAIGIKNARIYQRLEQRRQIAQSLGMEAFTSSGNVHALGNLITPFPTLLGMLAKQTPKTLAEYEEFVAFYKDNITPMLPRLTEMREIIETLHEPWNYQPAKDAMLHACVSRAIDKGVSRVLRDNQLPSGYVTVDNKIDEMLVPVTIATSSDMLTQAFTVILQNSVEAIIEYNQRKQRVGKIEIECKLTSINDEPAIELLFKDNGIGMKKEVLRRIYELGWTTKSGHRGFGLLWAHDYLEGLGGRIHVISNPGKETWVEISLPANYIDPKVTR